MQKTLKVLMVVGLAAVGVFLMGAGSGAVITGAQAKELVQKKQALLLDVRTPEEFAGGHVEGALNIPVQVLDAKLASLPAKKDQDVVIYCHSGRRSAMAKDMLEKAGYTKVHDLGAMTNWNK
jgi:rhodanese-related sulfurtransferase